ncbi:hypothetical protein LCGC14_0383070 [marine sediment metagenome]|uniref:Uncharacterized protein n=1 Tax=marine sediment metagenome TaxID=412755 RepID=A0A0F9WAI7_9ZZZZ
MTMEATADDIAQDGSIGIKVDGKTVKYVKESDLGAIKSASEGKDREVSDLQAKLATANSKYDTERQSVLQERAAKEVAEKEGKESATHKTRVGELETELAGLKTSSGEALIKLTDRVRTGLVDGYKIDAEKVKDMALGELESTEANLILVGAKPAPANYDGKGGGAGSSSSDLEGKTPLALATIGYETTKK